MPFFAGMNPTLYTQLSLLLSFHRLLSILPKISVKKSEISGEIEVTMLFSTNYRSSRHGGDDDRKIPPEEKMYDTPTRSTPCKQDLYFQIAEPTSTKTHFKTKPKYKSPSRLKRDQRRLKAYKERRWYNGSETPSAITKKCSPTEDLSNLIHRIIIEPIKHLLFILVFCTVIMLMLCR